MDRENIKLYIKCEALNDNVFKTMSIEELFDLRHDMLQLRNKIGTLLTD